MGGELVGMLGTETTASDSLDYVGTSVRLARVGRSAYEPFEPGHPLCFSEPCTGWARVRFDVGLELRKGWIRQYQGPAPLGEWDGISNYCVIGTAGGLAAFARGYLEGSSPGGGGRGGIFLEGRVGTLRMTRVPDVSGPRLAPGPERASDRTTAVTGDLRLGAEIGTATVFTSFGGGAGVLVGADASRMWNVSIFLTLGLRR